MEGDRTASCAARASAERFSWPQVADRYVELLEGLGARFHPPVVATAGVRRPRRLMRLLHVIHSDAFSGVERHVAVLAGAQAAAGHDVVVIGGDPPAMAEAAMNPDVRHTPGGTLGEVVGSLGRYARGADLVHAHMTVSELAAILSPGRRRAPVVSTRHFADRRGAGRLGAVAPVVRPLLTRGLAAQIAVSRYVADRIDGPSHVVYAGVADRPAPDPRSRETVILLAQRLEPEKRSEVALRAFAESGLVTSGWRMDVAGTGSERRALERLVTSASPPGRCASSACVPTSPSGWPGGSAPRPPRGRGLRAQRGGGDGVRSSGRRGRCRRARRDPRSRRVAGALPSGGHRRRGRTAPTPGRGPGGARAPRRRPAWLQRSRFTLQSQERATDHVYRSVL